MNLPRLHIEGRWFVDEHGRRIILRGVNLGGDCKVPYPDGGTNFPSDFSNHREVSFIGRPFPIADAREHFSRLRAWGFNCLRLLTTWEAVEHRGPNDYDVEFLDYFAELCRLAGDYGFYVFVDFHQDVWSRMSGGDGAPCWLFEKVGIDYRRIAESGSAHVMQHLYDYARGGRQEDRYPTMSWSANSRHPANGIMWTLFFAGRDFAPGLTIDGVNVQDYMLDHYLGAMREIAGRIRDLPNVMGFDSLNEPTPGWIGQPLSYRHLGPSDANPNRAMPGLAWSPIDGLLVSHGVERSVPVLDFDPATRTLVHKRDRTINPGRISIWADDRSDPFEQAGAWKLNKDGTFDVLRDNFFQRVGDRKVNFIEEYMGPFFERVAENIRAINPDWILFAELDPLSGFFGPGFPADTPPNTVNAGHWYDVRTLATKTFNPNFSLGTMTGEIAEAADELQARYERQLGKFARMSETVNGGAPTLIGECGIPFDLNGAEAYRAFKAGDRSDTPWTPHIVALDLMYNALDTLLINSTQWNYTASNRNDLAIGDGWNQEDLSIFSRDQQTNPADINSGGRALAGFVRPYAMATQGTPRKMKFDRVTGLFDYSFDADPAAVGATEIFVPRLQYPRGCEIEVIGGVAELDLDNQRAVIKVEQAGEVRVVICRKPERGISR
jgi:Glycoside hydrolase family 5 C-terminal domain/Cellulase (glycosyl hydrolase family 5)